MAIETRQPACCWLSISHRPAAQQAGWLLNVHRHAPLPVAMHSKLLELIGSITITSVRPPPSFFMKQCDRPCEASSSDHPQALLRGSPTPTRANAASGLYNVTNYRCLSHHTAVYIPIKVFSCLGNDTVPTLHVRLLQQLQPAGQLVRRSWACSGCCKTAGSAVVQLHCEVTDPPGEGARR